MADVTEPLIIKRYCRRRWRPNWSVAALRRNSA